MPKPTIKNNPPLVNAPKAIQYALESETQT